jgi:hypothetical protein
MAPKWWTLLAVCLATFMLLLDEAVVSGGAQAAARGAPPGMRDAVAEAARRAFIDGLNEILIVAAVVAFAGGVLAFALVRSRDFVARRVAAGV